ncbi:MAG TPA: hypothetical protein VFS10_21235, partial [Pyrinomonadaceae bacterium]|nr:hypothetical protein [Pyrinomonadaceae bacterium]
MRRGLGASTAGAASAGAGVSVRAVLLGADLLRGGVRAVLRGASVGGAAAPSVALVPVAVSAGVVSALGVLVREGVFRAAPRPLRVLGVLLLVVGGVSSARSAEVSEGAGVGAALASSAGGVSILGSSMRAPVEVTRRVLPRRRVSLEVSGAGISGGACAKPAGAGA